MGFEMEATIFLIYTVCLMVIYFFGKLLIIPLKIILKMLANSVVGGVILLLVNVLGGGMGIFLPINIFTAMIAGMLGIPGVAGLLVYFNW